MMFFVRIRYCQVASSNESGATPSTGLRFGLSFGGDWPVNERGARHRHILP